MKQIIFKNVVGVALRTQRRYKIILDRKKFNIKKPHQKNSGGVFGGEPINIDLFLTFYNN